MAQKKSYWLIKSDPKHSSISRLEKEKKWDWGMVRNYAARNHMQKMKIGDEVFFYHVKTKPVGIVGIARVIKEAYDDHTALDKNSEYYDPKATQEANRWSMVDIKFVEKFDNIISLKEMKEQTLLQGMDVLKKGNQLSVLPVDEKHFLFILKWKNKL